MSKLDELDKKILNRLQLGLPLVSHPWEQLAKELKTQPDLLRFRVQKYLNDGLLTRFGPMFDIECLGGAFTLAAMAVPAERFEEVAKYLYELLQVAHNYERDHELNMWFVLACETPEEIATVLAQISAHTGLEVLNLPKEETYHVGLYLEV